MDKIIGKVMDKRGGKVMDKVMDKIGDKIEDKAISYLINDPLLHMGMLEPVRRGTADIIYAEHDGVLLKEHKSKAWMISAGSIQKGRELMDGIQECSLIAIYQKELADYIMYKYDLIQRLECFQAAYLGKSNLYVNKELEIRRLEPDQIDIIMKHYHKLSQGELEELINDGSLFGGYKDENLIGFIGNHLEGSLGILEVFPEHRRHGYGTILESYMVNRMLEKGRVPFAQIETYNEKSIALQRKLGFSLSQDKMYWLFR